MNRNLIVIGLVVVFGIVGMFGYRFMDTNRSSEKLTDKIENRVTNLPVTEVKIDNVRKVLFFYANWCPECKIADEDLNKNKTQIPKDIEIVKVNFNDSETDSNEKDLARKYNILYQHTFVQVDENGNEVAKWNGGGFKELLLNVK